MARLAVFASGRGSNFVAVAEALRDRPDHSLEFLLCDKKGAPALDRASEMGVASYLVTYAGKKRETTEAEMLIHLARHKVDLLALAGFMRLLTPFFLQGFKGDIVNLHPSLLPKYPGAHGIEESYRSGDSELGISIMRIDTGCDTGPLIFQKSFTRNGTESLDEIERRIHELEHAWFPKVLIDLLDGIDRGREKR
jgi:phosphoribosylglycinamide formyltransferase-1